MILALLTSCGFDTVPSKDDVDTAEVVAFGDLTLSPANIDFGYVGVGAYGEETLVITNTGDDSISLITVSLDQAVFDVAEAAAMPVELGPGVDVTLTVGFEPGSEGNFAGTLSIATDGGDLIEVDVAGTSIEGNTDDTGNATGAILELSRETIQFGEIDVGKTLEEEVLLQNKGSEDILLVNITSTDSAFSWDKSLTLPFVLPAGTDRAINVTFSPKDEQTYSGTVTVSSDASNAPDIGIAVDGKGFHGCTVCAPQISVMYGGAAVYGVTDFFSLGGFPDTKELQVWNDGDEPLKVTAVNVTNDDSLWSCSFTADGFPGSWTIQPYSYEALNVTFNGTALCLGDSGQLTIASNDPYESTYTVELSGIALTQ